LRTPGHLLGELRAAHDADDPSALARYFAGLDREGRTAEVLMDAASLAVRDAHNDHIEPPKRGVCLKRLVVAEAAARRWVEQAGAPSTAAEGHRLSACWRLRDSLAELPSASLDAHAEPVRKYLCMRLQPLFEMEKG
jgi:hypothetical protein